MQDKVVVTRLLPREGLRELEDFCPVVLNESLTPFSPEQWRRHLQDATAVLCVSQRFGEAELDMAPRLKIVANYGVGYDNIDVAAATARGIPVTNVPDVVTDATADLALGLILAVTRRIVEGDAIVREGKDKRWSPMFLVGRGIQGKLLGILGMGRIGLAVARRAKAFGMRIAYYNRNRRPDIEQQEGVTYLPFDELLRQADVLSIHTPLTPATRHLVDARALSLMKPSAYLINTARGPVVDEQALIAALREGRLAGAGLDVFEQEPEVPEALRALNNVVLTPHIGTSVIETRIEMARVASANILAALRGQRPPHLVNPEVWPAS